MGSADRKRDLRIALFPILTIVFIGLLLRLWGIWNADSSDEYNEVFEALRVCSGHLNFERWGKRFYLYILSIEYGIYYIVGWILQIFGSPIDFATKIVRDLAPLFILARTTSALFGTASVFMTYLIGKSLVSKKAGLIASLFLCLNVVNIELSHYARVDATLCFVVLIAFYFVVRVHVGEPETISKFYVLAGIFSGIAFQNKLPAVIVIIPFLFAHLFKYQSKNLLKGIFCKELGYYGVFFILGLIIGNPAILFAPFKFVASLLGAGSVYTTPINESKSEHIGFVSYLIYFWRELGILLSILAGYSMLRAMFSKNREDILLLSFIIPFYLLMGASSYMVSPSYMIPLMPFLYILTSKYLVEIIENRKWSAKIAQRALIALCLALLIYPIKNVILFETSMSGKNTRLLAKDWIEKNIPFGTKILMDSGKSINSFAPRIAENKDSIMRVLSSKKDIISNGSFTDPTRMLDKNSLVYYELLLKTVPKESYDITSTMFGLDLKPIDYYIQNQYQYFIISKNMKENRTTEFFAGRQPEAANFYLSLDNHESVKLIKAIAPSSKNRGDTFYIYKIL